MPTAQHSISKTYKSAEGKLAKIKLLATDFDGIHTDGYLYVDQNGVETVRCSRKDGLGIELLKRHGIEVCVISKEANPVVRARCRKLNIECDQAVKSGEGKREILERIMKKKRLKCEEVAYMGDDLNDIPALQFAGIGITVRDAHPFAKKYADIVTFMNGGNHAIRYVAELILSAKGINPSV